MSKITTRAQATLALAFRCVTEAAGDSEASRKVYGGLCHSFPVMTRMCGLCQAIAFSEDKASADNPRGAAHKRLLGDVAKLLEVSEGRLLTVVSEADAEQYMLLTRKTLAGWIYWKRFAVSILKVRDARAAEDNHGD